jgi:SpoVK/Ycf46/Vps4 family AAA+-type ATPase
MLYPSFETELNNNGIHMDPDKNDLYVLRNCIIWMQRHILRYPCFDAETMKILCWNLGENMQELGNFVLSHVKDNKRELIKEELSETGLDPDDYATEIARILREVKSVNKKKFSRHVSRLMNKKFARLKYPGKSEIEKNILALKKMFGLSDKEAELCSFFFIVNTYSFAEYFFISHIECNKFAGQKYLANFFGFSKKALHRIIYGKLKRVGLYEIDRWGISVEDEFLNLIQNPSDKNLSKKFYANVPKCTVPLNDYFIGKDRTAHTLKLLKRKSKSSTHILFYGSPGTGKTSFAYSLLDQLNVPAYEIVRGDENTTKHRRAAIVACQNMTNIDQGSIVLIDEADNLLNTQSSWLMRGETQDKGWLNHLLDEPGARMIWITNRIDSIEDSVLRRFAFSLYFKSFNRRQRVLLWDNILRKNKCKKYYHRVDVENFAKKYNVSAGVIDLAIRKAKENNPSSKAQFSQSVKMSLESYETLVNYGEKPTNKDEIEKNYSLDGLNIEGDLDAMLTRLEAFDAYLRNDDHKSVLNMNLLFYGPPGTGKSELARYIANRLDRKAICKRVSDLQSMYVGEGEKNIKHAFLEAENEEAILIIDEADSLLFSRDRARHSWEISFTNEFLTQMERYRGILVCTTNRLKDLDKASIRRFNLKIGFDYLQPDGIVIFYHKHLANLISESINDKILNQLRQIEHLTPGDFKTVRDNFNFHHKNDLNHKTLLNALSKESQFKNSHNMKKRIGF